METKAEEIKNNLRVEYEKANALIINAEESFEKTLTEVEPELISEKIREIRNQLSEVKSALQKGDFTDVNNICREIEEMIAELSQLFKVRQKEREELEKRNKLPRYLLNAFGGDLNRTLEFVKNVENLPAEKLDEHIVGHCGRARVYDHLTELGGLDFFVGADPNDVKYYVYDYHFGNYQYEEGKDEVDGESSETSSDGLLADALRRAGLV
jgi:hypothetical protein